MSDNLELWNKVSKTELGTTKNFTGKGGFQGTAVCAQSQRKKATEIFGIYGIGWKVYDEEYKIVSFTDDHYSKLFYTSTLTFNYNDKDGSFPISAEIDVFNYSKSYKTWSMGNDLYKKVRTDAMTKGLSELGFNADVFEGKFDDNKYIQELKQEQAQQPVPPKPLDRDKAIKVINDKMQELGKTMEYRDKIKESYEKAKTRENFTKILEDVRGS